MPNSIDNLISYFKKIDILRPIENVPLDIFLDNIKTGKWEDITNTIRLIKDKKERQEAKEKLAPYVTLSGIFKERTDTELLQHSNFIGIDVDDIEGDINELKHKLSMDPYIVSIFVSIGGRGLCALFKINPDKHREAFQGIGEYLNTTYDIIIDPTSINASRARYVSYDPFIYINEGAQKFALYPKAKPPKKIEKVIFDKSDFEQTLKQLVEKKLNIADEYTAWRDIGFALAHRFGEDGRKYYHIISQFSSKYVASKVDRQYDVNLKRNYTGGKTISTFYYYAKQAGLEVYSPRTRTIAYSAAQGKKGGLNEKQVAEVLEKHEGITGAEDIIKQVFANNIELNEDSLLEQIELWVRQNYSLERNEITRYIENGGKMLTQAELNSIYIKAKKIFDKLNFDLIDRLINSDFVPTYNPFHRFFTDIAAQAKQHPKIDLKNGPHLTPAEVVVIFRNTFPTFAAIFYTIQTKDADYCLYFGAKWLVGTISAIHGRHSPLMFVLSGDVQNTGKTEWFRRLLPLELHNPEITYPDYYAESKLDAGKDDEILMTQKILIMDDEMGGKSKKEDKRLKELTSKQTFSLREPYGRNNVDLLRIAVLCGTTNENEILSDPTGNRRIIPIHVYSIDNDRYNKIDKTQLWTEVYEMYACGLRWRLDKADIEYLGQDREYFELSVVESELLSKYFEPGGTQPMTATDIKVFIERHTNQRLSLDRIGKELKRLKFQQQHLKTGGTTKRVYYVTQVYGVQEDKPKEDLPF